MRVPVTLVCVLLMLPMDAGPAGACRGPAPRIWAHAGVQTSYREDSVNILWAAYGDSVTIYCFGSHDKEFGMTTILNISGVIQPLEVVNATTVKLTFKRPEIESYDFNCTYVETSCVEWLVVTVSPAISVVSPSVRETSFYNRLGRLLFVPVLEHYEVLCSGNRVTSLTFEENGSTVKKDIVNQTTITTKMLKETANSYYEYVCSYRTPSNQNVVSIINVYVDHPPAATNFWCVEYDYEMKCVWSVLSANTAFTLFYADNFGNLVRLGEDHSSKMERHCEWNIATHGDLWKNILVSKNNITLIAMACNIVSCENQTFYINRISVMKSKPPSDLKVLSTSSNSALITWRVDLYSNSADVPLEHKILYRIPGIDSRELNVSSLRGECIKLSHIFDYYVKCEKLFKLPCSNTLYDVKVFAKLTTTPQTKAYWSDPAAITFYTDAQDNSTDENDPVCDTKDYRILVQIPNLKQIRVAS